MTFKELKAFISVYENRSISKAAERLYVTQPTLTRTIKKIEQDTGTDLFKRTADGLIPTVAGEIYNEYAVKMLDIYRETETAISRVSEGNYGKLTIGTTFFLGSIILPIILKDFAIRYPHIEIKIIEGTSFEIQSEINKGLVDIGIIHDPVNNPHFEIVPMGQERILVAVPADDAVNEYAYTKDETQLKYLDIKLLSNRNFALTHPGQRIREQSVELCHNAGFEPNAKYVCKNIQTAVALAGEGLAFSFIPSSYLLNFDLRNSPNYYNIEENLNPEWHLVAIYSKYVPLSKSMSSFIDICKEILPTVYNF